MFKTVFNLEFCNRIILKNNKIIQKNPLKYKFWWKKILFLNHEIYFKGKQKNILFLALNISIYNTEYINVIKQEFL